MLKQDDDQLLKHCQAGDHTAFESLVQRYQLLVCSIAYSIVGNVASSEDIGQEAFLVAWKKLRDLRDPKQFKSWLSTITRNEARAWLRRRTNSVGALDEPGRIPASTDEDAVVDSDEADLVWNTLSQLPESYREPLILYYRQDQSVAEVADALALSQSATKQRLARGREMLRTEVFSTIERSLKKTVPTAAFTVGVMAVVSGTSKTAAAATAVTAAKLATGSAAKTAIVGAAAGSLIGLLGGFFGAFNSWYHAEYQSQRSLIVRASILYLIFTAIFMVPFVFMQFGWHPIESFGARGYQIAHAIWMVVFLVLNSIWMFWVMRGLKKIEQHARETGAERLPRYKAAQEKGFKHHGRRWTSRQHLLGLPFVQVAFPDWEVGICPETVRKQGTARAWIAIGHRAHGRIVAIGHRAIAPLALGTQAVGALTCGVFSVGLVSFGVISIAPLALGVLCIGGISLSCALAVGILAVGPMAFGIKAAKGAMAAALQFAEGPSAFAPNANNEAAREFIASAPMMQQYDQWMTSAAMAANQQGPRSNYWVLGIALVVACQFFLAKRRKKQSVE